jgi:hypothetical protein
VNVSNNPSIAELLNQLRGASVTLATQGQNVTGTIMGVESRTVQQERGEAVEVPYLNLLSGVLVRSLNLQLVTGFSLDDAQLQSELTMALAALSRARDLDRKPVTINYAGGGERRLRVGYVVESPIWKTSYRLFTNANRAYLQGWAIVENQTENDWSGVALSLVSGRPISFVMDLYNPLYAQRPVVAHRLGGAVRPQLYGSGIMTDRERVALMTAPAGQSAANGWITGTVRDADSGVPLSQASVQIAGTSFGATTDALGNFVIANAPPGLQSVMVKRVGYAPWTAMNVEVRPGTGAPLDVIIAQHALTLASVLTTGIAEPASGTKAPFTVASTQHATVNAIATTSQPGALFQYQIANVSLRRQSSAMLPIISDSVEVEHLSIYNNAAHADHPLIGLRLKNSTGNHLLQGPVTVADAGGYAGDARMDDVAPGQERLISFGVDVEMIVARPGMRQTSSLQTVKIARGVLSMTRKTVATQEYETDNRRAATRTIIIEHPVRAGWTLVSATKPIETTATHHRFQGTALAQKVTTLTVSEERITGESITIRAADSKQLLVYAANQEIPANVRSALARAASLSQALTETKKQIEELTARVAEITREQERIRENMKTVSATTQYYERLLAKLDEQESAIEAAQSQRAMLQARLLQETRALEDYLEGLSIG